MNTISYVPERNLSKYFISKKGEGMPEQMTFGILREDMREELIAYMGEQKRMMQAADIKAAKAEKPVKLTKEQRAYLSGKYNPHHMTREEYTGFVQEMVEMGVLTEEETSFLNVGGAASAVPLFSPGTCGNRSMNTEDAPNYCYGCEQPFSYASSKGDIMNWYSFEAAYRTYDETSQTYYLGRRERIFSRLYGVLKQMDSSACVQTRQDAYQKNYRTSRTAWDLRNSVRLSPKTTG